MQYSFACCAFVYFVFIPQMKIAYKAANAGFAYSHIMVNSQVGIDCLYFCFIVVTSNISCVLVNYLSLSVF